MTQFTNGIHDIPNDVYHGSAGLSRSALWEFKRSPYHYWYKYLSGQAPKQESTPDMAIGSAVHTLILEPQLFADEFYITTQQTRPRRGTAPYDAMLSNAGHRTILTPCDVSLAQEMADTVRNNKDIMLLLDDSRIEQSMYFTHDLTGIQCKVRPDSWGGGIVCDIKTTADASLHAFKSSAATYGYYLQAAMIYYALKTIEQPYESFVFIAIEKRAPFATAVYTLSDDALEFGLQQFDDLLLAFARCQQNNKWPAYGIQELGLPGWLRYDQQEGIIE